METLAKLGIDGWMLLAQIFNFAVLLLILNKFLYKPIIKEVEKNEEELHQAEKEKQELIKEKEVFLQEKSATLERTKEESQAIINGAKDMAKRITEENSQETEKIKTKMIQQARGLIENENKSFRKRREEESVSELISSVKTHLQQRLFFQTELQNRLNDAFFQELLWRVPEIHFSDSDGNTHSVRADLEKLPVRLEYVLPLSDEQRKELESVLNKAFPQKKMIIDENKELICGFCLEMGGLLIESNLLHEIKKAYA